VPKTSRGNTTAGSIENARDEMGFHAMMLAALFGSPGSVEVAEGYIFQCGISL